jgi:hypothetical protein
MPSRWHCRKYCGCHCMLGGGESGSEGEARKLEATGGAVTGRSARFKRLGTGYPRPQRSLVLQSRLVRIWRVLNKN